MPVWSEILVWEIISYSLRSVCAQRPCFFILSLKNQSFFFLSFYWISVFGFNSSVTCCICLFPPVRWKSKNMLTRTILNHFIVHYFKRCQYNRCQSNVATFWWGNKWEQSNTGDRMFWHNKCASRNFRGCCSVVQEVNTGSLPFYSTHLANITSRSMQ